MSRTAAIASSVLRRLAAASSRPSVQIRPISTGPISSRRSNPVLRQAQALSPAFFNPSRGFARGRKSEAANSIPIPSDDEEVDEENIGEDDLDWSSSGDDDEDIDDELNKSEGEDY